MQHRSDVVTSACAGNLLRKVQSVQNAAARLFTSARRCDHITPVLHQLHWLPVQRQTSKIEDTVFCTLVASFTCTDLPDSRTVTGHFAYWSFRLRDISPTAWTVRLDITHLILFYSGSLVGKMKSNL